VISAGADRRNLEAPETRAQALFPPAQRNQPSVHWLSARLQDYGPLIMCFLGIHFLYCFYALCQEFLASHTFEKELFVYPVFLIAVNHTTGGLLALIGCKLQSVAVCPPGIQLTGLPAAFNFMATFFQHQALYYVLFPTQTLCKTLKLVPVMIVGKLLKNRKYDFVDYSEAALITGLVVVFVWRFQATSYDPGQPSAAEANWNYTLIGLILMLGYIVSDSFLSNLQDYVYQARQLEPVQMLIGLEVLSSIVAWSTLLISGQLQPAVYFLCVHREASMYVLLLALTSALGAYTCTLTVRLFGPAVFTLLMMSRQVLSLVLSVIIFQHPVDTLSCMFLVVVAGMIIISSCSRVAMQLDGKEDPVEKAVKDITVDAR